MAAAAAALRRRIVLELRLGLRNEDGARFWRKKYVTAGILWFLNARDQLYQSFLEEAARISQGASPDSQRGPAVAARRQKIPVRRSPLIQTTI